jgi:predicted nucleic-acid-binding Zn-ribbon protein
MRNGHCPKCGSKNIFTQKSGINFGSFEVKTAFFVTFSPTDDYICIDCGYFERYIDDKAKLMEVSHNWTRVA